MFETPVVLLIFNRPHTTARVLDAIRGAQPRRLFVVADGPRNAAEAALCDATRAVLARVDWPCQVVTNFAGQNLGCGRRVSSGLDWVFDQVTEAVILEDDCVPEPMFFRYCAELLARYRAQDQVMMVCGHNPLAQEQPGRLSYHFSQYGSHWGWATWRRSWRLYDFAMTAWHEPDVRLRLQRAVGDAGYLAYQLDLWAAVSCGRIDTWDCQWTFMQLLHGGLAAVPSVNLISNIGFSAEGTHTRHGLALAAQSVCRPLSFPLDHPPAVAAHEWYDRQLMNWRLGRPEAATVLARVDEQLAAGRHAHALLLLMAMERAGLAQSADQRGRGEAMKAQALRALGRTTGRA